MGWRLIKPTPLYGQGMAKLWVEVSVAVRVSVKVMDRPHIRTSLGKGDGQASYSNQSRLR